MKTNRVAVIKNAANDMHIVEGDGVPRNRHSGR